MNGFQRFAGLCGFVVASAVSAHAVVFSNVTIQSPPLSDSSSWLPIGNSISFFTPNALVGDPVDPLRSGTLNIQYDADSEVAMIANEVVITLGQVTAGSGFIAFIETVFEIDEDGNELGGPIGSISKEFFAGDDPVWSDTIVFSREVRRFRAKKSFTMSAVDTDVLDLAAVAQLNQNITVVPEPATMAGLALGGLALARRRRK